MIAYITCTIVHTCIELYYTQHKSPTFTFFTLLLFQPHFPCISTHRHTVGIWNDYFSGWLWCFLLVLFVFRNGKLILWEAFILNVKIRMFCFSEVESLPAAFLIKRSGCFVVVSEVEGLLAAFSITMGMGTKKLKAIDYNLCCVF